MTTMNGPRATALGPFAFSPAFTSPPDLRRAHGTAEPSTIVDIEERRSAALFQSSISTIVEGSIAVLEQPSPRRELDQALG
jgi:hypothetical protein